MIPISFVTTKGGAAVRPLALTAAAPPLIFLSLRDAQQMVLQAARQRQQIEAL